MYVIMINLVDKEYYFIKGVEIVNGVINHTVTSNVNEALKYEDDTLKEALKHAKIDFKAFNGYKVKTIKLS